MKQILSFRSADIAAGHHRGGFTFAEVLFAVMILGVGFIMVAGVLPVAIQQSRQNVDEFTARNVALAALADLRARANDSVTMDLPSTYTAPAAVEYKAAPLQYFAGSRVYAADPRFMWSVVYSRNSAAGSAADVYIIVQRIAREITVGSNTFTTYQPWWLTIGGRGCEPQPIKVKLSAPTATTGSRIEFTNTQGQAAAINGAYVICRYPTDGTAYRLSRRVSGNIWEVDPSSPAVADSGEIDAFIIGSALEDPTQPWNPSGSPPNVYAGPAQDIYLLHDTVTVNP